jgi:hypothetical protein
MRCSLVIVSRYNTHIWIKENNFSPFILYLQIGYYKMQAQSRIQLLLLREAIPLVAFRNL